jgi:hypothetical protein
VTVHECCPGFSEQLLGIDVFESQHPPCDQFDPAGPTSERGFTRQKRPGQNTLGIWSDGEIAASDTDHATR